MKTSLLNILKRERTHGKLHGLIIPLAHNHNSFRLWSYCYHNSSRFVKTSSCCDHLQSRELSSVVRFRLTHCDCNKETDICRINKSAHKFLLWCSRPSFNAFHRKAIELVLACPTRYERRCCNRNTMIAVEDKFGGQALLFSHVTAGNPKHREYDRSDYNLIRIVHEFIASISRRHHQR